MTCTPSTRRPGLEPGPIPRDVAMKNPVADTCSNNGRRWLWVPAFAGTTCGWFDLPVGQSPRFHRKPVQPCLEKYFAFSETQISCIDDPSRPGKRGVSRSSRTRGGMRWTRLLRKTNGAARGRRSRVVLTPRRWRQACKDELQVTVATSPVTGESTE